MVVAVTDAADRGFDPGLGWALGAADRHISRPAISVMHEAGAAHWPPIMQRPLNSIQNNVGTALRETRQPTILRATVVMMKATRTKPIQIAAR